jgi:cell division GTPase FtsZ
VTSNAAGSLDLCAIGLGQAGGWLAADWRRRGYRSLVLNTARSDLRGLLGKQPGLEIPGELQLDISIDGLDGAGHDPAFGRRCVRARGTGIRAAVEKHLKGADALLLMAGLGGGTGSAVDELARVLEPLGVPLVVVCTLPADGESAVAKVNAARAADAVLRLPVAGRVFVDNGRLLEAFPDVDVVSYFQKVNARVLQPLDELNRLNGREDVWSLRSFDGEDLRRVLLSSGSLLVHEQPLKGALSSTSLVEAVHKAIDGGDLLARGTEAGRVAYIGFVVVGSERALKAAPMHAFVDAAAELKKQTHGGAVFDGVYVTSDEQAPRVLAVAAALGMPKRVAALVDRAAVEGGALANKIAVDLAGLDTSVLDGLALFRGPRGAGSLPPVPTSSAPPQSPPSSSPSLSPSLSPSPSSSTSLPPMPTSVAARVPEPVRAPVAVAAVTATAAPPMQPSSTVLPPTMAREAVRPATIATTRPSILTEAAEASSKLPSIPDDGPLPAPTAGTLGLDDDDARGRKAPGDDHTQEGEQASLALPSLPPGPQSEAEELVERYRAGDRKTRERVGRKLLEDSRATDVAVRMLAVWAMVQLRDGAFRRALTRCSNDDNAEVARLAIEGLDALGDVPGVD